jgi:transposase
MNAILLVLRTSRQWNALSATGICSCSSAYRRFREWTEAGVFLEFWRRGLLAEVGRPPSLCRTPHFDELPLATVRPMREHAHGSEAGPFVHSDRPAVEASH